MTSRYPVTVSLAAAAVVLAGCAGESGIAAPASPAPPTSTGLRFGAPAVPAPLNPASIEKAPCDAMTADQVASLGAPLKTARSKPADPTGPACSWIFDYEDVISAVTGAVFTADPTHGGISGLYGQKQFNGLTRFEPFSANGYPGVIYDAATNSPPGSCGLAVGLRDDLTYTISVDIDGLKHPFAEGCELGKKVAGYVIQYLQKGGR
ncbi:uncharacterized protein DUF3558 [Amycolatopsis sulphurea]|uniref:Uncharacterized protein DUF3558 n=1 Tax=Amycolatopsis sulphurea TaxID=76022 RepID=A0A2A9FA74_9PSEU|nr:DUF3558 domain-containing protein [Amycolatopsis sulphurea]PFG48244.1 uncharacterized protein DUF3558 [Amycolatopsis sulphurea]